MVKNPRSNAGDAGLIPGWETFPGEGEWQPPPVFLPEESHGQRSLAGYSPKGCKELDMTERLTFTFTVSLDWCLEDAQVWLSKARLDP